MKSSTSLPILLPLLFLTILSTTIADEVYGKIVCSHRSLIRLPFLKEFLKGGNGAAIYNNVDIEFERGEKATLTIHKDNEDGQIIDTIILSEYETEKEMHDLFKKFGFQELTPEEIEAKKEEDQRVKQEEYLKLKKEYNELKNKMKKERKIHGAESELADNTIKSKLDELKKLMQEKRPSIEGVSNDARREQIREDLRARQEYLERQKEYSEQYEKMKVEEKISEVESEQDDNTIKSKLDKVKQLLNENQSLMEGAVNDKKRFLNVLGTIKDVNVHEHMHSQLLNAERMIKKLEKESTKLKKKYEEIAAMEGDEL